jgi:hypothetical protein
MRFLMTMAASAALLVRSAPVRASDPAPSPAPAAAGADSMVQLAGAAARTVDRDEAAWREQTARLAKAVEAFRVGRDDGKKG